MSASDDGVENDARSGEDVDAVKELWDETKRESTQLMDSQLRDREARKREIIRQRQERALEKQYQSKRSEAEWRHRMRRSAFMVDLVAEHERIGEETYVRVGREKREQERREHRRDRVKNDIILKALSEASDLEALREEKRAILLQEKRLKALLDLEKAKLKRKEDLLKAQRAEKHRREAKGRQRREARRLEETQKEMEMEEILREKHGLPSAMEPEQDFTFPVGKGVVGALGGRLG